jgi:hypothetical protein
LAAFTTSTTSVFRSLSLSWKLGFTISHASALAWSKTFFFITPGRTVAMQGRNRGQMMVAIRWPPKAGRVIFRFRSSISHFWLSTSRVLDSRRNWM